MVKVTNIVLNRFMIEELQNQQMRYLTQSLIIDKYEQYNFASNAFTLLSLSTNSAIFISQQSGIA